MFIEKNARIQVEYTVTEKITDVDLVTSQLRIARVRPSRSSVCARRGSLPTAQRLDARIYHRGPCNGLRPDTGRITGYRTPAT